RVHLKSDLGLRKLQIDYRFADIGVKGRGVKGNILTKNPVDRVSRISKAEQDEIEGIDSNPEPKGESTAKKTATKKGPTKKTVAKKAPTKRVTKKGGRRK
ncbi:MAG: hypothetical protein AAF357_15870, partial [Verrucomicrobiota bacterium]